MCRYEKAKTLKIAMLGHKRVPSREGGVEIVVGELSSRMASLGYDVTVYNRRGHHVSGKAFDERINTAKEKILNGVKILSVPTIDLKGAGAVSSSFFASLKVLFGHYDCVHYHAEGPCAMLWIPHLFGIRTVATIHGLDWQRSKWNKFAAWYLKLGEKIAAKYADKIIVLSDNVKRYFKDTYNRDTVYVSNGISKPVIKPADIIASKWNLKKDSYILYVGRIVPEKGIHYLIDAYGKLKTDKILVIAGGASDTDEYFKKIKESAKDNKNIIFTGFVQGDPLEELYSNAYIYCLPTDLEGMPISLLEAMSYGNCCVTSDIPECTEVYDDKAVSFKKSDSSSLLEVLQNLCDNEDVVKKYKEEASDFILKKYNWDATVDKTVELYHK